MKLYVQIPGKEKVKKETKGLNLWIYWIKAQVVYFILGGGDLLCLALQSFVSQNSQDWSGPGSIAQPNVCWFHSLTSPEVSFPSPLINLNVCEVFPKSFYRLGSHKIRAVLEHFPGHLENVKPYWNPNNCSVTDRHAVCNVIMNSPQDMTIKLFYPWQETQ